MFSKEKKRRVGIYTGLILFSVAGLFFLLRGPYLSNSIKRVIIPVIESATGERIIIDNAVINLFPFYLQTKGFKVFDKDGNKLLWVTKTRVYIDLFGLLANEIRVRRLTLKEPELTAGRQDIRRIRESIKRYLTSGQGGGFRFILKNIRVTEGKFLFSNTDDKSRYSGNRLYADIVFKKNITVDFSLKEAGLQSADISALKIDINAKAVIDEGRRVEISEVMFSSSGSVIKAEGEVHLSPEWRVNKGNLSGNAHIEVETIGNFFGIRPEKDGVLTFEGFADILPQKNSEWPAFVLDLDTDSRFYLETLMKILKINENIKGRAVVKGKIRGIYPELLAEGDAKLEGAIFDRLLIDNADGKMRYEKRRFSFSDITAYTYKGKLKGDAHINVPSGDYSVTADVSDVVSPRFFEVIRWNAPFPEGRINGKFRLNKIRGQDIEVMAGASYVNTVRSGEGPLNSLEKIDAQIEFRNKVVKLKEAVFLTPLSSLYMNGNVDTRQQTLSLEVALEAGNAVEVTAPSFRQINAPVSFTGKVSGSFKDPMISGLIKAGPGSIYGLNFRHASGDLTYRIGSLSSGLINVKGTEAAYKVAGSILFRGAKEFFSYNDPFYRGSIEIASGSAKDLTETFYSKAVPLSGIVDGTIILEGEPGRLTGKGDLLIRKGAVFGKKFDRAEVKADLDAGDITFNSVTVSRNDSRIMAKGAIFSDERFKISASSDSLNTKDIFIYRDLSASALTKVDLNGSGTLRNPHLDFHIGISEGSFRGTRIGTGVVNGVLDNKEFRADATFLKGVIAAKMKAHMSGPASWTAEVNFKKGNYDTLFAAFLGEAPENVSASIEGNVRISGKGEKISMVSKFSSVYIDLYGYSFRNRGDIILERADKDIMIKAFSLEGDEADISASGSLRLGESFDLKAEGSLDIAPLRALTDRIKTLKGEGEFNITMSGPWEVPDIKGEVKIGDAVLLPADLPYRIGPINGTFLFEKDRFTFESLRTGLSGGTVDISGAGYFRKFSLKRLFFSAGLNGIRISPMDGISAVIDGDLFYESLPNNSSLVGDISVRKAKYKKRFELKSWLLGVKETKKSVLKTSKYFVDTELDIRVSGSDNIVIDNNLARAPVRADLNIVGTVSRYGLIGKIEADEGSIYFRGNDFRITDGRLEFVELNDIAPVFHIQAETTTGGYLIKLDLDGTMDKFRLFLISDPPLSEMDILTLLTSGHIETEDTGFEGGIAASEATAIITGSLQDVIEEKIKLITGIERFEINPQTTVSGSVGSRITVGKRLLEDRLSVIYSTSVGTTEENIVRFEYSLDRNISVIGSRDETGSTGMDFKYRFEFK